MSNIRIVLVCSCFILFWWHLFIVYIPFGDFVTTFSLAMVLLGKVGAVMVKTKEWKDICSRVYLLCLSKYAQCLQLSLNSNLNLEIWHKPWFIPDVDFTVGSHPNGSGLMDRTAYLIDVSNLPTSRSMEFGISPRADVNVCWIDFRMIHRLIVVPIHKYYIIMHVQ